jgi:hypothetical protein
LKSEGKRQFGRPRRRWEANIEMDLKEIGCAAVEWVHLLRKETGGWLLWTQY